MNMLKTVLLLLTLCFFLVESFNTHPRHFHSRARGGSAYQTAVKRFGMSLGAGIPVSNTTENYFDQLINHGDPKRGTFRQRFYYNHAAYQNNGLAFLYIGGEGPETGSSNGYDAVVGSNMGAMLVTLEHRYYGKSKPAPLTDKATLHTLNTGNVMADVYAFLDYFERVVMGRSMRWVVVGGSYAGAVSAWLKVTFPNRFIASWSSSGVVNARFDYTQFDGHIKAVLPPACLQAVKNVMTKFSEMYDDPTQRPALLATFGTKDYFTKSDMAWMLADGSAMAVQYGGKDQLCSALVPAQPDILAQYATVIQKFWGANFTWNCYYSTKCLSDPSMSDQWEGADYCWVFQCCNELAYWQVAYPNSLRDQSITSDYYIDQCRSAFWPDILSDTYKHNAEYGGAIPNATNVVATQGSDDPWKPAGVQGNLSSTYLEYTAVCDGCGHCGDLFVNQTGAVAAQQAFVVSQLTTWIQASDRNGN